MFLSRAVPSVRDVDTKPVGLEDVLNALQSLGDRFDQRLFDAVYSRSLVYTVWHMLRGRPAGTSHAARLSAFYRPQAAHYDRFRERLLAGRADLIDALDLAPGQRVVALGAGTGRNAEFYAGLVPPLARLTLVDLCASLFKQVRVRTQHWPNGSVCEADACTNAEAGVDRVYFSYALSMMPEWRTALDDAIAMLAPDGRLGVLDFYVSDERPPRDLTTHSAWTRHFWPWWFGHDGERLDGESLRALHERLTVEYLDERTTTVPWLPGARVHYFVCVGCPRR